MSGMTPSRNDPAPFPAATEQGPEAGRFLPLGLLAAGLMFSVSPWASPAVALALGIGLSLAVRASWPSRKDRLSGPLLRTGVVLLGFRMSFGEVVATGFDGLVVAVVTIIGTMGLGVLVGRRLGVGQRVSTLISAGTAVCGGSAIVTVASVIGATHSEIAVALGTVFVLNAVALYLFPALGGWLGLEPEAFGLWSGIAIHDLSSVVGAASQYAEPALQVATTVKLSRTLWIVPLVLALSLRTHRAGRGEGRPRLKVPYFVLLFLLASLSRDWVPGVAEFSPVLGQLATALLTAALFVIGTEIRVESLRQVGWRPMAQGLAVWVFISIAALVAVALG
ncbi:MAG: putative sulfate exporter family transporter [Thermoanaerobaculia bacterium]|nr:putative sulfate exporter family transporter [Thermoanaerobaculia bacterium]